MGWRSDAPDSLLPSLPEGARLLVIRLRSLGDLLLATPAFRALKQWRPDLRLSVLVYSGFAPILAGNPDLEEVIAFNPAGAAAPVAIAGVATRLRRRRFAACFNLHGGTLSALLTWASGAPHRIGFRHFRFGFVYSLRTPDTRQLFGRNRLHTVETQLAPFYAAGLPQGEIPPLQLFPQADVQAAVAQALATRGVRPGSRYAVVHPVANFFTKEWPFERYAELARVLEEDHGLAPVFTCGPGEGEKLDAVAHAAGKALKRLDSLSLPELVALMAGATLFVGNDSGPAHIAAALGRPAVVLYGSSDSSRWHPWRAPHAVVQNYYPCNPCRGDRCYAFAQPECILSITLEQVRAAVERLLAPVATGVH
jgi:predicted lipopolysaccharide heptosyltransferase III